MSKDESLIRCVHKDTHRAKWFAPAVALNAAQMKHIGFIISDPRYDESGNPIDLMVGKPDAGEALKAEAPGTATDPDTAKVKTVPVKKAGRKPGKK